jgi:hypothetical protein
MNPPWFKKVKTWSQTKQDKQLHECMDNVTIKCLEIGKECEPIFLSFA